MANNMWFNDEPNVNVGMSTLAHVKVIGVGGGGGNAVNLMVTSGVKGVRFVDINTDAQVLAKSQADDIIAIGKNVTKGLGAGANPNKGFEAAVEAENEIKDVLRGADLIFITAGMGGGTGTGAAPFVAKVAKELGIITVAVVTRPFSFEGTTRCLNAERGIEELRKYVDSIIIVSNDRLIEYLPNVPLQQALAESNKILQQCVLTITDLISQPALINLDFADVRTIVADAGLALIGIGMASEGKAQEAAAKAISSPLLEASIIGAKNAIVNITGGPNMPLNAVQLAIDFIRQNAGGDMNLIFGAAINPDLKDDQIIVTVIATGFEENQIQSQARTHMNNFNRNDQRNNSLFSNHKPENQNQLFNNNNMYQPGSPFRNMASNSQPQTPQNNFNKRPNINTTFQQSSPQDFDDEVPMYNNRRG